MKPKPKIFALLITLAAFVAATPLFAQTVHTWTGGGDGIELGNTTNWGGTLPNAANGDIGVWNGTAPGNLLLTNALNVLGTYGVAFSLATVPGQTGSISINPPAAANSGTWRFNYFTNWSGAGAFTLGNNGKYFMDVLLGTSPETHYFENDSANTCTINFVQWRLGGGGFHPMDFLGSGNWVVNSRLRANNNASIGLIKEGSGTMIWSAGPHDVYNSTLASPCTINGGTLILESPDLLGSQDITNSANLQYDAASGSATFSGVISGSGSLAVTAGQLTLSGANTYTGNTLLTNGTLILNRAENPGVSGPLGLAGAGSIVFAGGTLQFSVANIYDYSPRFSTAAGQQYVFNTGGQNVTFTNDLASVGATLTKAGPGTLTLGGASSYSGLTTVSGGKLVFSGSKIGSGDITVADSATFGVTAGTTQVTPGTLTLGASGGASLEFYNVTSTTTAPLAAGALSSAGTLTINIIGGSFAVGQSYPLLSWTSGSAPTVNLGSVVGAVGNLSIVGNTVQFNVTKVALTWDGGSSGVWDTTTANNWLKSGSPVTYADGDNVSFGDAASGSTNVIVSGALQPGSVTVYNSSKEYSITSSGADNIGGSSGLSKGGSGSLALLGGVNTYSGVTTFGGGTVVVGVLANGGVASDIGEADSSAGNIVFNGGTLQYTNGAASIDRLFTVATGGGAIDASGSGALSFNNSGAIALSGTGSRVLTLKGSSTGDNTLAASLSDNGGGTTLAKADAGKWVLTGTNSYSGGTTVVGGTLQVGAGGSSGSLGSGNVTVNASLIFNRSDSLTNGVISGTGSVTVNGVGTVVLPGDNTYSGGTTINSGATLQVGAGDATGSLNSGSSIADNGTLIFDTAGESTYLGGGLISGTGNVIMRGTGLVKLVGANTYTGWTTIDPGATLQVGEGNAGTFVSSVVTNNGTLKFVRQDFGAFIYTNNIVGTGRVLKDISNFNPGDVTLLGNNTYTGNTFIAGGAIILGDGATPGAGYIVGDVIFTNSPIQETARTLEFNRAEDSTFSGKITYSATLPTGNRGIVQQNGANTLTLTGDNDYPGGTVISGGVIQVGNGGTTGAIGTGPVTDNSLLAWNRSDAVTFGNVISGAGQLMQWGSGVLTLTATNTYTGDTTITNGTLVLSGGSVGGNVFVSGGTFVPASLSAGGRLDMPNGSLVMNSGTLLVPLNRSLTQTNVTVDAGGVYYNGGALVVTNVGSPLVVGDKFYLFNQPVSGLSVSGAGATWQNDLAVDGSITALTVPVVVNTNTNAPVMQVSVSGNTLALAWPTNLGWTLQTNSVGLTAADKWFSYPGSATITNANITINPATTNVFFRMVYTNTP